MGIVSIEGFYVWQRRISTSVIRVISSVVLLLFVMKEVVPHDLNL
jgi:hypothetical protein